MLFATRIAGLAAVGLTLAGPPARSQPSTQTPIPSLRQVDHQVASVGHRLATRNLDLCPQRQWLPGFLVHDLSQYPLAGRHQVAKDFGLDHGPAVLALVADSPAAVAGLRVDDVLLTADSSALPKAPAGADADFTPTERIIDALEQAFSDGRADLTVLREGKERSVRIKAEPGCATRFQVIPSASPDAKADGRYVQITSSFALYARDDHELAALLAHELAHNILRHRARLKDAGVVRGPQEHTGRSGSLIRQTELEADRLAVHLMHRAGYDPSAAMRLWDRQRRDGFLEGGSHPRWAQRIAAMNAEIAAITAARARREQPAIPRAAALDADLD